METLNDAEVKFYLRTADIIYNNLGDLLYHVDQKLDRHETRRMLHQLNLFVATAYAQTLSWEKPR